MDERKAVKVCKDILLEAKDLADEFFPTKNEVGQRIAVLSIANILVELRKEK